MSERTQTRRVSAAATETAHAPPARIDAPFALAAHQDGLAGALNRSVRVRSLAQTRQMMDDSPRLQAQRALERTLNPGPGDTVQREAVADEEELLAATEKPAQRQSAGAPGEEDEQEVFQGRFETILRRTATAGQALQAGAGAALRPNRTGLPDGLKVGVESLSGLSLDGVHVHYNSAQPAQLSALAYAQGTDIHVGPGQETHLPHEAWHVVQQMQGRVRPTLQVKGAPINDDAGLEREADRMGAQALQMARHGTPTAADTSMPHSGAGIYQRVPAGFVVQLIYLWDKQGGQEEPVWSDEEAPEDYLQSGRYTGEHGNDALYTRLGEQDLFYGLSYEEGPHEEELNAFLEAIQEIGKGHNINVETAAGYAQATRLYEQAGNKPFTDVSTMNALYGGSSGWNRYPPYLPPVENKPAVGPSQYATTKWLQNLNPDLPWATNNPAGLACQVTMIQALQKGGSVRFLMDGIRNVRGILEGNAMTQKITSHELRFAVGLLNMEITVGLQRKIIPKDGQNVFFYLNRNLISADAVRLLEDPATQDEKQKEEDRSGSESSEEEESELSEEQLETEQT